MNFVNKIESAIIQMQARIDNDFLFYQNFNIDRHIK